MDLATTADTEGPEWSSRAEAWAEHWGEFARPAFEAVARATGIGAGARVLDVGCGSGEFCRFASGLGAKASGIDAAEGMIQIARRAAPGADLRVGPMEALPWDDDSFDLVTGFNAFQFAADLVGALREAKRVTRDGGLVAVCNWSPQRDRELWDVFGPLRELEPPSQAEPSRPDPPPVGEPGVLEDLARQAGLKPVRGEEVEVPYSPPDLATLERAVICGTGFRSAVEHSGAETVRRTIAASAAPFRQPDGSYLFRNKFRCVVAKA